VPIEVQIPKSKADFGKKWGGINIQVGFPMKGRRERAISEAIAKGMVKGSETALKIIRKYTPVFKRKLKDSIKLRYNQRTNRGFIGSKVKYLPIMEKGRKKGSMPPVSALIPWVKRRFKISGNKEARRVAWGVAINIKNNGIEVSAKTGLKHDKHSPKRGAMFRRAKASKEISGPRGSIFRSTIKTEVMRVRARLK